MVHGLHAVLKAVLFLFGIAAAAKRESEVWFKKQLTAFGFPSSEEAGAGWLGCLSCLAVCSVALCVLLGWLVSLFLWH